MTDRLVSNRSTRNVPYSVLHGRKALPGIFIRAYSKASDTGIQNTRYSILTGVALIYRVLRGTH